MRRFRGYVGAVMVKFEAALFSKSIWTEIRWKLDDFDGFDGILR
jgi:hypothetical protein